MHSELMLSPSPSTSGTKDNNQESTVSLLDRGRRVIVLRKTRLTCVFDGEVGLALHGGGQLVHAQRQLPFERRRLLTERWEASEGALPGDNVSWGVPAGYHLGSQGGHGGRRGGCGGCRASRLVRSRVCPSAG